MSLDILKQYELVREEADGLLERIDALVQVVAAAARAPEAQSEVSVAAVGVVSEVICEDVQKLEGLFDKYQRSLKGEV
ncbi:MAG: hypothetical protein AAF546_08415 [Verrucomicrobiota bacterium]